MEIQINCSIETKSPDQPTGKEKMSKNKRKSSTMPALIWKILYLIILTAIFSKMILEFQAVEGAIFNPRNAPLDLAATPLTPKIDHEEGSGSNISTVKVKHSRCRCFRKTKRYTRRRWGAIRSRSKS